MKQTITQIALAKSTKPTKTDTPLWHDPFIAELHETRRKLLVKAGNNMHQLILNAQQTAVKQGFGVMSAKAGG